MKVRAKLLVSQSLNIVLIVVVASLAVLAALRLEHQLRRVELAHEQRQTITMLTAQAFNYKTTINSLMSPPGFDDRQLRLARDDLQATLQQLRSLTEREQLFVSPDERVEEAVELERIGRIEAGLAVIDSNVDRIIELLPAGAAAEAEQLHQVTVRTFRGEIAPDLAAALVDEGEEVTETDIETDNLVTDLVLMLIAAGAFALAISLVTGVALHRSFSRPVERLVAGVRALQGGDLKHRIDDRGSDEFAQLAGQFNVMTARIEDRERRLLEAQSDLERQVAQRTGELRAANERLTYLDRQRLRFLAEISHELRTPVTVLRGEAEVSLRGQPKSAADYREVLERVVRQAEQMGRLIDDLLFLVRSEADTVTFDLRRVDLRTVVSAAIAEGEVLARGRNVIVDGQLPDGVVWVDADAQRLRQAVLIAIDNAIKYSHVDAAIEVSLAAADGRAAIAVRDYGVGIPTEDLPYVFERFYRIRAGGTARVDGTGLGLPIAKWIVEKHGGTIRLASTPGQMTTLTIEIPAKTQGES